MKINLEDFVDFIKNDTWVIYASETIKSENYVFLRLWFNAKGFYRVTKDKDVMYFGVGIKDAVDTYNTFSN